MVGCVSGSKTIWNLKVNCRQFFLPRKSWLSEPTAALAFFPLPLVSWSFCRLFRLAVSLAFLNRFSSSESDANSSDSYSATTCQPSLLLSAIFISFCRLRISSLASWEYFLNQRQIWFAALWLGFYAFSDRIQFCIELVLLLVALVFQLHDFFVYFALLLDLLGFNLQFLLQVIFKHWKNLVDRCRVATTMNRLGRICWAGRTFGLLLFAGH